ncbi:MAG: bifunctional riboflavin kinase/FAD synthetase [Anaerovibrio sp.]|uniref:bifunctional riboflavin kinase/FAD synthetase n=1 Tax=Anaerovibrio sp. TaxID=1872532 RepID=UPI0025DB44D1|nr:bifunctional riboflavin kinase/FAD synthetase [Anaerovibrio sp.]MCR5175980.1 bifunctional riboflavin kinase/FAD synthetase [Anaerovibrio sp.]
MQIFNKFSDIKSYLQGRRTAIALGTFDGVHVGHQSIIRQAMELAEKHGLVGVVFTFLNHPLSVVAPDRVPFQIGDNISKAAYMEKLGVDILLNVPFSEKLSRQSPEEFLDNLCRSCNPEYLVTGPNFTFGKKGKGNSRMLSRVASEYGFVAEVGKAVQIDGRMVSSTQIRALIEEGDLVKTNEYLGKPFSFGGRVVHGDHRGRTIGFPTANLAIPDKRAMLPNGAYGVYVLMNGQKYKGIANIGTNPTFDGCKRRLEVHILDFSGNLYDCPLTVQFVYKLREEKKFSGADALVRQLHLDEEKARSILADVN